MKNIVLRLQAVKAEEVLHVDNEFLSSIFRVMPATSQTDWLKFGKSTFRSKWAAFMQFLDDAREQALQTKVLMAGYDNEISGTCHKCGKIGHKSKNCGEARSNSAIVAANKNDEKTKSEEKKKAKEDMGKCPLCKNRHTYTRLKDRQEWPSDRLFKCDKFKTMSIRERADTLQRLSACPKCTSWNHIKSDCTSPAKCGMVVNGSKCNGEHSSLVCGSGNAYCGALRSVHLSYPCNLSSSDSEDSSSSSSISMISRSASYSSVSSSLNSLDEAPDIHAQTLLLFQDVPVVGGSRLANFVGIMVVIDA